MASIPASHQSAAERDRVPVSMDNLRVAVRRPPSPELTRFINKWATRIIPLFLAGCIGFATYVVIHRICWNYLRIGDDDESAANGFLIPYCVFLFLAGISYLRLILVIKFNPGLVPLSDKAIEQRKQTNGRPREPAPLTAENRDIEAQRYDPGPDVDPDSPGLEKFYTKEAFICEPDGRPKWCSHCLNWKPDRTHHCRELNRCVRKMDHFCPWVGGIISETSFKFFAQFVFYGFIYCALTLAMSAYTINRMIRSHDELDATVIVVLTLSAFFGIFSFSMSGIALDFIFRNQTHVDNLQQKDTAYQVAIHVPRETPPTEHYGVITYPIPVPGEPMYAKYAKYASAIASGSAPAPGSVPLPAGDGAAAPISNPADPIGDEITAADPVPAAESPFSDEAASPASPSMSGNDNSSADAPSAAPPEGATSAAALTPQQLQEARDLMATRTFAIVKLRVGENPWNLGWRANFASVMGRWPWDWLLPLRQSPCAAFDSPESQYQFGEALKAARRIYQLPEVTDPKI